MIIKTLKIQRFYEGKSFIQEYKIELDNPTLLEALFYIKAHLDSTLSFESSCRSGVCGSCALRVNAKEILSCSYRVQDGDLIEPLKLKNYTLLKDLIVIPNNKNKTKIKDFRLTQTSDLDYREFKQISKASECISCSSCYSSCPVYEYDSEFLAPFMQVSALRYINSNQNSREDIITNLQNKAIWDCTMCGNCNMVCPAKIDIKGDIMKLRTLSVQDGYSDPNMASANMGFNTDFGFNPNF
jgi:fumarate reductase iron-sulfur subunit